MDKPASLQKSPSSIAARAAKWKDPKGQRFRTPNVPKTTVYTQVSLMMLVCLGVVFFYDFIQLVAVQHPDATTQHFSVAVMILHVTAICLGLITLLHYHLMQAQYRRLMQRAVIATVGNLLLMILRIIFELVCCRFREEMYSH